MKWWGLSHGRKLLPTEVPCTSHQHPPLPGNMTINAEISVKFLKGYKLNIANVARGSRFKTLKSSPTMFQNLSKATTKPEHTPLSPLKVLMWTLTLILSWTHRYSSPKGLPSHTETQNTHHRRRWAETHAETSAEMQAKARPEIKHRMFRDMTGFSTRCTTPQKQLEHP